jgi:hypothetical protein
MVDLPNVLSNRFRNDVASQVHHKTIRLLPTTDGELRAANVMHQDLAVFQARS